MPGSPADPAPGATLATRSEAGATVLCFAGMLDSVATSALWSEAMAAAAGQDRLVLDLAALTGCDTTGAALLAALAARPGTTLRDVGTQVQALLDRVQAIGPVPAPPAEPPVTWR